METETAAQYLTELGAALGTTTDRYEQCLHQDKQYRNSLQGRALSNALGDVWRPLCNELEAEGYLFIRAVLPKEIVRAAHDKMQKQLERQRQLINQTKKHSAPSDLVIDAATGELIGEKLNEAEVDTAGWKEVGQSLELKRVYESDELATLFRGLSPFTGHYQGLSGCTWLRAKAPGQKTREHSDYMYFRNNMADVFMDPFRPARTTDVEELCPQVTVSPRIQRPRRRTFCAHSRSACCFVRPL